MLNRRTFLQNLLSTSIGAACPFVARANARIPLSLRLAKVEPTAVPRNFPGLGYEMSSVATPGLLRVENRRYVELIRGLGPEGVLRLGGIVANYTRYEPNGAPAFDRHSTVITRSVLEQFGAFLSTIGWSAIWSVNFAQGSLEQAVEEARAVSAVLGSRLLALEIGNEVDTYGKGQPFRSPAYDYADYREQYEQWHAAITRAVPGIRFAAPDTAQSAEWVERMAQDARGRVQLLTTHYYRNGQARGSAEQLTLPDPRLRNVAERLRIASQQSGIPWRMCEMNSFSGGGRPGVSDTFIGALWTLNVMLYLAQSGCAGINIETGVNQSRVHQFLFADSGRREGREFSWLALLRHVGICHRLRQLSSNVSPRGDERRRIDRSLCAGLRRPTPQRGYREHQSGEHRARLHRGLGYAARIDSSPARTDASEYHRRDIRRRSSRCIG